MGNSSSLADMAAAFSPADVSAAIVTIGIALMGVAVVVMGVRAVLRQVRSGA